MERTGTITLFMCGDVMTGRGIDQILPHPSNPMLYEPYIRDATDYVYLAETAHGPIPMPAGFSYVWGDALDEFRRVLPDVKIINLETSVTSSEDYERDKGINYRMHPRNISCITSAGIDCCSLANNHILDWGYTGLAETIETLNKANIKHAGAGKDISEAEAPAVINVNGKGRVIIFSFGVVTSGISSEWAASEKRPGVNLLTDLSYKTVRRIGDKVRKVKQPGDIVVASIHWGDNWGYEISFEETGFAHGLIDDAGVDIVHGHSSHHVKAMEVHNGKPVLYGCGDFLNDYEGIGGYKYFRGDLSLMYFPVIKQATGKMLSLNMTPTKVNRFRIERASKKDAVFLAGVLNREGIKFGTRVDLNADNTLTLKCEV